MSLQPTPPPDLNPFASEVLEALRDHPAAAHLVIGGGVALQHYCPHRPTVDLDGWWRDVARGETEALLEQTMKSLAEKHRLTYGRRAFGDTQSFELRDGGRKVFTVQVSVRSVLLDQPLPSHWNPILIETFRDNLGAKMNALVGRGAPRDFSDVFEVCHRALATPSECWALWREKNPGQETIEAKARVRLHLEQIAARRPLENFPALVEQERAKRLRAWVREEFCKEL